MKIIRSMDGTARREVELSDIKVPDMWHLYIRLREDKRLDNGLRAAAEDVLETWHIAHDLLKNLKLLEKKG